MLRDQGRDIVAFERYMTFRKSGGNHCQINVLPVPRAAATRAEAAFQTAASTAGITLVCLPPGPKVCTALPVQPYCGTEPRKKGQIACSHHLAVCCTAVPPGISNWHIHLGQMQ